MDGMTLADKSSIVKTFIESIRAGQPRADLLTSDAGVEATRGVDPGLDKILKRMSTPVYSKGVWEAPTEAGDAVRILGKMPAGQVGDGALLTIHFKGDKISLIQTQTVKGQAASSTALKLPDEIKELVNTAFKNKRAMVIAYVDETGSPVLTYRGSTTVVSDTQLGTWIRNAEGDFMKTIKVRPKVALMYRNYDTQEQFEFRGRARVSANEAERETVYNSAPEVERNHDFAKTGVAVVIELDAVEGFFRQGPDRTAVRISMRRGA